MTNLSDLQTMLLSAASCRETGSLLPPPENSSSAGARVTRAIAALVKRGLAEERGTDDAAALMHSEGDRPTGVFITAAGAAAIAVGEPAAGGDGDEGEGAADTATSQASADGLIDGPKLPRPTKAAAVLALLERGQGATLAELIAATGWLPHTTRAALTGLRKKGYAIGRGKRDGATCYSIAGVA